ncbi:MAG: hypothetical protein WBW16_02980 [Bacteroidota bacterium]
MRSPLSAIILLVITLSASLALAGAILNRFVASRGTNGDVVVEWTTGSESDLKYFEVQRMAGVQGDYTTLGFIQPNGSNSSYQFVDKSAYKTSDAIYKYRLAIVNQDGSASYSQELTVRSLSGVKRTWGSIKAMFR